MEEADHLCTRIGIMNFGRLRCLGTQNRLKSKFGTGYQLAFNCAPGRVSDVEQFVRNNLRKAVHIETYAGMVYNYNLVSRPFHLFNTAIAKLAKVL
jgi:ABC-type multidrug transport system ATPase subunit